MLKAAAVRIRRSCMLLKLRRELLSKLLVTVERKQLTDLITDNEYVVFRADDFRLSKGKAC